MRSLLLYPALLTLVAVGCGGPATVNRSDLERQTRELLEKSTGRQALPVTCPEPLKVEVGATTRCRMDDLPNRQRLGIAVKITKVTDDDNFRIHIKADQLTDIK